MEIGTDKDYYYDDGSFMGLYYPMILTDTKMLANENKLKGIWQSGLGHGASENSKPYINKPYTFSDSKSLNR